MGDIICWNIIVTICTYSIQDMKTEANTRVSLRQTYVKCHLVHTREEKKVFGIFVESINLLFSQNKHYKNYCLKQYYGLCRVKNLTVGGFSRWTMRYTRFCGSGPSLCRPVKTDNDIIGLASCVYNHWRCWSYRNLGCINEWTQVLILALILQAAIFMLEKMLKKVVIAKNTTAKSSVVLELKSISRWRCIVTSNNVTECWKAVYFVILCWHAQQEAWSVCNRMWENAE